MSTPLSEVLALANVMAYATNTPEGYRVSDRKGREMTHQQAVANIVAIHQAGEPYGWNAMTAMRMFHNFQGKLALKPEAILGLLRDAGHSVDVEMQGPFNHKDMSGGVTLSGVRADTGDHAVVSYTMREIRQANISSAQWENYPEDMLFWRAMGRLERRLFPDMSLGAAYTPEELGGEVSDADAAAVTAVREDMAAVPEEPEPEPYHEPAPVEPEPDPGPPEPAAEGVAEVVPLVPPSAEPPAAEASAMTAMDAKNRLWALAGEKLGHLSDDERQDACKEVWGSVIEGLGVHHVEASEWERLKAALEDRSEPF